MSMRIFSVAILAFALVACGTGPEADSNAVGPLVEVEANARSQLAESGHVFCAVGEADLFRPECTIDRMQSEEGLVLTIRHPDGGFRRLLVTTDGRGLVAADGAEPATVTPVSDDEIEVEIASDRYRLPATVR